MPVLLLGSFVWLRPVTGGGAVTSLSWLVAYLMKTLLFRGYDVLVLRKSLSFPAADNASHLGGAWSGLGLGVWYLWRTRGVRLADEWDSFQVTVLSIATLLLVVRQATNF